MTAPTAAALATRVAEYRKRALALKPYILKASGLSPDEAWGVNAVLDLCAALDALAARPVPHSGFPALVSEAIAKARAKHPPMPAHRHAAYAIILEELDEVKETVWHDAPAADFLKELVHTAAMCQRAAEDLALVAAPQAGDAPRETLAARLRILCERLPVSDAALVEEAAAALLRAPALPARETLARALCEMPAQDWPGTDWFTASGEVKAYFRKRADAVLARLGAAPTKGDGT